ncbi:MAG: Trm112 family protein [Terracidiphilus sp.]
MSANSQPAFDAATLSRLACPACHSELHLGVEKLTCAGCGRAYPIVDGIPVLIKERAETGHATTQGK